MVRDTIEIILYILPILIGFTLVYMFIYWLDNRPKYAIYIKFKTFMSFYNVSPGRWKLNDNSVSFVKAIWAYGESHIGYKFHFLDFYKYKLWHRQLIKQEKIKEEVKEMLEMTRIIREDANKLEEKSKLDIQKAEEDIKRITFRI